MQTVAYTMRLIREYHAIYYRWHTSTITTPVCVSCFVKYRMVWRMIFCSVFRTNSGMEDEVPELDRISLSCRYVSINPVTDLW